MTEPANPADLFQQGWQNYRLVLEHDYLWHRLAAAELTRTLMHRTGLPAAPRFLDLACGDAATSARVLSDIGSIRAAQGHPCIQYMGVDSSPMALAQSAQTPFGEGVEASFVETDFVDFLRSGHSRFDVIYVGMLAHHLGS